MELLLFAFPLPRSPLKEQEDVFFAVEVQKHPSFTLADRGSAYKFCLEVSHQTNDIDERAHRA